ncbi:MAG: response regulator [Thermoanaerobaculia bacterium]
MLVDDHEGFRLGIRTELLKNPDLEVVAEADRVQSAIDKALAVQPDVLVLDMDIEGFRKEEDGATVAAALRSAGTTIPILVLSAFEREGYVLSMLAEGVAGYLLKTESLSFIVEAVRGVACGQRGFFSREIIEQITKSSRQGQELTPRELEVLQFLDLCNEDLAGKLRIKIGTVKKHVGSILAKFGVESRAAAISLAWQRGLISKRSK